MGTHHEHSDSSHTASRSMAASATLHCLTGCALGEVLGLMIGTALGWSAVQTIALAVGLAFLFGYALSTLPLLRAGLGLVAAIRLVLVADTLSIATMELVDNGVMALVPGAMDEGLANPVFWLAMGVALAAAFAAAYPVNAFLIGRGRGHALTHQHMDHDATGGSGTAVLAAALAGFLLGGLAVSVFSETTDGGEPAPGHGSGTQQHPAG